MVTSLPIRASALTLVSILLACGDSAHPGDDGKGDDSSVPDASTPSASCSELALDVPLPFDLGDAKAAACSLEAIFKDLPPTAIVCSGEDSHGIVESAAAHGIVLEYLMRVHGVRTLLMEADDGGVALLDQYVETGEESLLTAYFGTRTRTAAGTNEGAAFIRHLRELSMKRGEGDRLRIRGIDVSVQLEGTFDRLQGYFSVADPVVEGAMRAACPRTREPATTVDVLSSGAAYLDDVIAGWDEKRDGYVASTDLPSTELAYADLLNLRDGYRFLTYLLMDDFATGDALHREPGLERNLLRAADRGEPMMLIAHNTHCAHGTMIGTSPSLGSRVSPALGSRYVVIGQSYGRGTQRERSDPGTFVTAPVGARGNWDSSFNGVSKLPQFIMLPSQPGYDADDTYIGEYGDIIIPSRDYDALVFLSEVTASTTFTQ